MNDERDLRWVRGAVAFSVTISFLPRFTFLYPSLIFLKYQKLLQVQPSPIFPQSCMIIPTNEKNLNERLVYNAIGFLFPLSIHNTEPFQNHRSLQISSSASS